MVRCSRRGSVNATGICERRKSPYRAAQTTLYKTLPNVKSPMRRHLRIAEEASLLADIDIRERIRNKTCTQVQRKHLSHMA